MTAPVVDLIEAFEYAVSLARGQTEIDKPVSPEVSTLNMVVANAYAVQIYRNVRELFWRLTMDPIEVPEGNWTCRRLARTFR